MIGRIRDVWNRYWFAEVDPHALALVRISLSLFLLVSFAHLAPHVDLLFARGGVRYSLLVGDIAPSPWTARCLFASMPACAVLMLLGVRTRWAARALLCAFLYHYLLALAVCSMVVDRLVLLLLAIASLAELDGAWSLLPEGEGKSSVWAQRMITMQLAFLYVGAGVWKLLFPAWRDGVALRENLYGSWGTELGFALARAPLSDAQWQLVTWGVIAFELALGFAYLSRKTAPFALLGAACFHLSVFLTLGIWEFFVCLAVAPAALDPELVARWARRLRA